MACPTCGNSVLFGGIKDGKRRYCSKRCYEADEINRVADTIPDSVSDELSLNINQGNCPKCGGPGPVDLHKSYSVYSFILITKWSTNEHLLCVSCARKQQATDLLGSLLLGWWGIPFGLIVTPIMIISNVVSMFQNPGEDGPSKALKKRSKLLLAKQQLELPNSASKSEALYRSRRMA